MHTRIFHLPDGFSQIIATELEKLGFPVTRPKLIAEAVLRLSDHYNQNPEAVTPWQESWAQAASLAYFFPLNLARNLAVAREAKRLGFFTNLTSLLDFGSGTGSALFAFADNLSKPENLADQITPQFFAVDASETALSLARCLSAASQLTQFEREVMTAIDPAKPPHALKRLKLSESLLTASYVLTELESIPEWWLQFEGLAIIEPSTQDDGRALMKARSELQEKGYSIWAPCTHQQPCPLLTHSARDWCHDRIHWQAPAWYLEIEKHLPMKNRTLTFSYLLARKSLKPPTELSRLKRLTGDMLEEKGKTRQSICCGPEREFLAWFPQRLPKGERIELQRGNLLQFHGALVAKSNELRISSKDSIAELEPDAEIKSEAKVISPETH